MKTCLTPHKAYTLPDPYRITPETMIILKKPSTPVLRSLQAKNGFTLVELIVVISILAILGTIAFLSFGEYQSGARDSVRSTDLSNLSKSLDIGLVKVGSYPSPDNSITVSYSG